MQESRIKLPIGYDDFGTVVENKLDFVDKSLFIKEILDRMNIQASVITRPRRFGKTFNLSQLRYFLAPQVRGRSTSKIFNGLKIAQAGDHYMRHQGQYPVIFITFKDVKGTDFDATMANIGKRIASLYHEHAELLSSPQLTDRQKQVFSSILEERASLASLKTALYDLSSYLYQHYGSKVWILIDEYDTPIQAGYLGGYYDLMIDFMRGLFGNALKTNDFLQRAVVTGILRISKESLFSGANNIRVCSIMEPEYSEHFGFTETEVCELLKKANLSDHYASIRLWYNGYQIGNSTIYNPWSVINCLENQGQLRPYWVNTSGNDLVKHLLARGDKALKKDLETIIQGESITALIDEKLVFGDLEKDRNAIWSLLFFCGYLKTTHIELRESQFQCELIVPNQEMMALYRGIIRGWLSEPLGSGDYLEFLSSLTEGRVEEFADRLQQYLLQTMSLFDSTGNEPEKFYHGFVLGMMVSLSDTHEVKSNHESGYGRYDVMLIPKDREQLGIILEFKTVRDKKTSLKKAAKEALQQIKEREYETQLRQQGIPQTLSLGLAFRGKQVFVLPEKETVPSPLMGEG